MVLRIWSGGRTVCASSNRREALLSSLIPLLGTLPCLGARWRREEIPEVIYLTFDASVDSFPAALKILKEGGWEVTYIEQRRGAGP